MNAPDTFYFETYGCQMNVADSAALKLALNERGWAEADGAEGALLVVINTCSVRQTAEQRALGRLAHYAALKKKRRDPLFVLVCGCMASRLGDKLIESGADFVMGTQERSAFTRILAEIEAAGAEAGARAEAGLPVRPTSRRRPYLAGGEATGAGSTCLPANERGDALTLPEARPRVQAQPACPPTSGETPLPYRRRGHGCRLSLPQPAGAFVPIMRGCDNFCSYCIVPYVRGREVCRDPDAIAAEIASLAEKGVREVTLLGQNVNSYTGGTLDFPALLERIAGQTAGTAIRRVRFLSSHPKDISRRTIEVMAANPVFCRHLHLCVQHGSNRILAAMNRRYTRERFLEIAAALRAAMPGITLSTDILVGFPGETDGDFEEILSLMDEVRFLYAYTYHYNPREGTAAFDLPGRIEPEVKAARLRRVIELQKRHTEEALRSRIGSLEEVLVERPSRRNAGELLCRTERDETAVAEGPASLIGSFAKIRLEGLSGATLRGRFLEE